MKLFEPDDTLSDMKLPTLAEAHLAKHDARRLERRVAVPQIWRTLFKVDSTCRKRLFQLCLSIQTHSRVPCLWQRSLAALLDKPNGKSGCSGKRLVNLFKPDLSSSKMCGLKRCLEAIDIMPRGTAWVNPVFLPSCSAMWRNTGLMLAIFGTLTFLMWPTHFQILATLWTPQRWLLRGQWMYQFCVSAIGKQWCTLWHIESACGHQAQLQCKEMGLLTLCGTPPTRMLFLCLCFFRL